MTNSTAANAELSARQHSENLTSRYRKIALAVVALAFVMDLLDSTIVNIAIPSIQSNLGATYTTIQWLVAGYSLAFALLLITGGRMGDVFGYKKMFMVGVAGFTLASLLSGVAWNTNILILARLVQGAMAALMVPQVMSLMQVMYKPEERTGVNGLFGALGGLAASMGPIIGGILIKANLFSLDWRPIFLINVPIGIFGLLAGAKYLPEGKSAHPLRLDLVGTGIVVVALTLLVFPLIQGRELGWPTWTYLMIAASIPVLGLFAWWQVRKDRKDGSPLVLPALFHRRSFSVGMVVNIIFPAVMLGFFLTSTLLIQIGLGYSVLHAAVAGIPTAIGISFTIAILSQRLIFKIGRYALTLGACIMALGLWILYGMANHYGIHTSAWAIAPGLLVIGTGMGLVMMTVFATALNDVDHNHAGSASGTLNAVQQVGGAIGIALIGVIFFGQLTGHANASVDAVTPALKNDLAAQGLPSQAQDVLVSQVKTCFNDRAHQKDASQTPESCQQNSMSAVNNPQEAAIGATIEQRAKEANTNNFINAFRSTVVYETGLLALVFLLSFLLPRHISPEAFKEAM
jgi:EmrB/QacA subfamily drug resistance transporter